jgi:hypothetical protein
MSKYYLAKFEDNCADEFDVYGFVVLNEEEYSEYSKICDECRKLIDNDKFSDCDEFEICCGSNESIYFENAAEFILSPSITEITEQQYKAFIDLDMEEYGYSFWYSIFETYEDEIKSMIEE